MPPNPLATPAAPTAKGWRKYLTLSQTDLLRDAVYRRLWLSIFISSFGMQVTMLALPLTAAVLLHATPTQMGLLTATEIAPFVLFSLPGGVWLDRVRKLPVYVVGEGLIAITLASVPLVWWLGYLSMAHLYAVSFVIGLVNTVAGSAAQIVLTQIVPRERLVEAHAKNAMANSAAETAGPGLAGALIKLVGAPFALLADAALLITSVFILRGLRVNEHLHERKHQHFWHDLQDGLRFVWSHPLLPTLALLVGAWQLMHHSAMVVQILVATRLLGLTEQQVGLSYVALGLGTVVASAVGNRLSARLGPGPMLATAFGVTGIGWLVLSLAPTGPVGVAAFVFMLLCFAAGATLLFINFLALRQAVTPAPLLGRMTSVMRWLILLSAGPGALWGGWLGEHLGLRAAMAFGGVGALVLAGVGWSLSRIRALKQLPVAV